MAKSLKIAIIGLFLIVDLVVAILAIKHVDQRPASSPSAAVTSPSTKPSPVAKQSTREPKVTGLAVDNRTIARFAAGSCERPGNARLELSTSAGASFTTASLPSGTKDSAVAAILSVDITSPTELSLIGMNAACERGEYTTRDGGKNWTRSDSVTGWYVDQGKVGTAAGPVNVGCAALSVSSASDRNAKAVCADGQIRGTDDGGKNWIGLGKLDRLTAATFTSIYNGFGAAKDDDCASRVYSTGSAGGNWTARGCIDKGKTATAVSGSNGVLGALVDGQVYTSSDTGMTWKKP